MSGTMCNDNRFDLIAKYKAKLIEATNIETSTDEMAVIDNILFRLWQMGWLDRLEQPTASPWHSWDEEPKESGKQYVVWASKGYAYCDKWLGDRWLISSVAPETVTHWMPIEPPKEDA